MPPLDVKISIGGMLSTDLPVPFKYASIVVLEHHLATQRTFYCRPTGTLMNLNHAPLFLLTPHIVYALPGLTLSKKWRSIKK